MTSFIDFLEAQSASINSLVLIAHNGESFDFPVLMNSLKKHSLLDRARTISLYFLDSLPILRNSKDLKEVGGNH